MVSVDSDSTFFSGGMGGDDMFSGMGGGGRGGRSRGSRMGGGMPGMGGGFGGMPGGFGGESASAAPPPPGEIIRPLALTLEELYTGGTKRLKITRHMRNGSQEERVLEVAYKPGWKKVSRLMS
jgi:DnaJ family protein B protein 4